MSRKDRKQPEAEPRLATPTSASTDVEFVSTAALIEESYILKIFHMSLRSYNCLKQFLGFPKHYLILEIFICVNEESQRARA